MSVPFRQAPFKTSGGTTSRSLDGWFGDVVNVREFANLHSGGSGMGTSTGNDTPAIQAALDLAFGTAASPHGLTNKHLNRPVFFPAGRYRLTTPLTLTQVVGGHIYGAGTFATSIHYEGAVDPEGPLTSVLHINGASDLCIERMEMAHIGSAGFVEVGQQSCCINLDWTNTDTASGSDGLHDNHFSMLNLGAAEFGVVIADSGNQGHNNLFVSTNVNGYNDVSIGYDVRGAAALNQQCIGGGGLNCGIWARCPVGGGSLHHQGFSTHNELDYLMESGHIMHLSQGRTESDCLVRLESGTLIVHSSASTGGTPLIVINGGKAIVEGNYIYNAEITGTGGELLLAGNLFGSATTPLSGYSGTIVWDPENVEGV